jgi:5'(3')-deoxyribonucleotidase
MVILIDMDNVAANLMKKWLDVYNQRYGDTLTGDQIMNWQIDMHATKCDPADFYGIIGEPGFFADLDVMPDAVAVASRLKDAGHELYFVTATPYNNPTGGYDKCNWVQQHFPFIGRDGVIQAHKKHMVIGDLLFDDSPKNLKDFPGTKVAMDWNFNKNVQVNYRVTGWLEFEKVVHQLVNLRKPFRDV